MTLSITHKFVSSKGDSPDTTLVNPSNWNDTHTITMASGTVLGRFDIGSGAAEEISIGRDLSITGGVLASTTIPLGTVATFYQAAAPTGWTQVTTKNDFGLRVVSGAGGVSHGTVGLSTFISNGALGHALSIAEMPSHNHSASDSGHNHSYTGSTYYGYGGGGTAAQGATGNTTGVGYANISVGYTGGNAAHTHGLSDLQYMDVILCSKN